MWKLAFKYGPSCSMFSHRKYRNSVAVVVAVAVLVKIIYLCSCPDGT
jgi:hypothetical protein